MKEISDALYKEFDTDYRHVTSPQTLTSCERQAELLKQFWQQLGYEVDAWVQKEAENSKGTFVVRSNMVGGRPRGWRMKDEPKLAQIIKENCANRPLRRGQ